MTEYKNTDFDLVGFKDTIKQSTFTRALLNYGVKKDCSYCRTSLKYKNDDNKISSELFNNKCFIFCRKCNYEMIAVKHYHKDSPETPCIVYCCEACNYHVDFTYMEYKIYCYCIEFDISIDSEYVDRNRLLSAYEEVIQKLQKSNRRDYEVINYIYEVLSLNS